MEEAYQCTYNTCACLVSCITCSDRIFRSTYLWVSVSIVYMVSSSDCINTWGSRADKCVVSVSCSLTFLSSIFSCLNMTLSANVRKVSIKSNIVTLSDLCARWKSWVGKSRPHTGTKIYLLGWYRYRLLNYELLSLVYHSDTFLHFAEGVKIEPAANITPPMSRLSEHTVPSQQPVENAMLRVAQENGWVQPNGAYIPRPEFFKEVSKHFMGLPF